MKFFYLKFIVIEYWVLKFERRVNLLELEVVI